MLLDPENHDDYVWADSIYSGEHLKDLLCLAGFENRIHEKGSRNNALSAAATESNYIKPKIRSREEHVLGCCASSMRGKFTRISRLLRINALWSLKNLTFNFWCYLYISSNLLVSI